MLETVYTDVGEQEQQGWDAVAFTTKTIQDTVERPPWLNSAVGVMKGRRYVHCNSGSSVLDKSPKRRTGQIYVCEEF
jgi:hypothetical protein